MQSAVVPDGDLEGQRCNGRGSAPHDEVAWVSRIGFGQGFRFDEEKSKRGGGGEDEDEAEEW